MSARSSRESRARRSRRQEGRCPAVALIASNPFLANSGRSSAAAPPGAGRRHPSVDLTHARFAERTPRRSAPAVGRLGQDGAAALADTAARARPPRRATPAIGRRLDDGSWSWAASVRARRPGTGGRLGFVHRRGEREAAAGVKPYWRSERSTRAVLLFLALLDLGADRHLLPSIRTSMSSFTPGISALTVYWASVLGSSFDLRRALRHLALPRPHGNRGRRHRRVPSRTRRSRAGRSWSCSLNRLIWCSAIAPINILRRPWRR